MVSLPIIGDPASSRPTMPPAAEPPPPATRAATRAGPGDAQGAALNPSLRLDLSLDLVIMEFRNSSGVVTETIPSDRQLNAYRIGGVPGRGATAAGGATGTASPPV